MGIAILYINRKLLNYEIFYMETFDSYPIGSRDNGGWAH